MKGRKGDRGRRTIGMDDRLRGREGDDMVIL